MGSAVLKTRRRRTLRNLTSRKVHLSKNVATDTGNIWNAQTRRLRIADRELKRHWYADDTSVRNEAEQQEISC